jgi:hypothetical protein
LKRSLPIQKSWCESRSDFQVGSVVRDGKGAASERLTGR